MLIVVRMSYVLCVPMCVCVCVCVCECGIVLQFSAPHFETIYYFLALIYFKIQFSNAI
jgi:hypothetical protein